MYSVVFTEKSEYALDIFINSYRDIFFSLYSDTGIQDKEMILSNYRSTTQTFKEAILQKIEKIFSDDVIFWRRKWEKASSFIFRERSFLIIIDYTEDTESKTRYIENIIFTRK